MTFWQRFQSQWRNKIRASTLPKVAGPKCGISYAIIPFEADRVFHVLLLVLSISLEMNEWNVD